MAPETCRGVKNSVEFIRLCIKLEIIKELQWILLVPRYKCSMWNPSVLWKRVWFTWVIDNLKYHGKINDVLLRPKFLLIVLSSKNSFIQYSIQYRYSKNFAIFWYIAPHTGISVSEQHITATFRSNWQQSKNESNTYFWNTGTCVLNTWRHISEYGNIHTYRCKNLKFCIAQCMITQYKQFHIQTSHYLYVLLVVDLGTVFVNNQTWSTILFHVCLFLFSTSFG
jgi:hypothetical protein